MNYEPSRIIVDNEAAISMAKCNKDTVGNRHVARRYCYLRQGTILEKHIFERMVTKNNFVCTQMATVTLHYIS